LLAHPDEAASPSSRIWGAERSSLIEGALACAGFSRHREKIPFIIMVSELAGSLIQIKPPSADRRILSRGVDRCGHC